jgi:hypothetical protein
MADMEWTDLAQDRDMKQALANMVKLFMFDKMWRVCWLAKELLPSQEGLYSMQLTHWHTQPSLRWPASHIHSHTQPAVGRSEPSMSFAFNFSLLSVDGMTCLIPFESWRNGESNSV